MQLNTIFLLFIILFFTILFMLFFLENNLLFYNYWIIEGMENSEYIDIPISGKINQNILTLDNPTCISQGSFLKNINNENILDISGERITITIGSIIKLNSYQLSGYTITDISNSSQSIDMIISTKTPCPKQDIPVLGSINGTTFSLSSAPNYTIYPGYLLFSSGGNKLKDSSDAEIIIISGENLTYIISGEPMNNNTLEMQYIIREP